MAKNDQFDSTELAVLLRELNQILVTGVNGDIVELGCYKGVTSVEIAKALRTSGTNKRLYLYDSFAGLPAKAQEDVSLTGEQFVAGELPAKKRDVIIAFKHVGLLLPKIKKAWFDELESTDLPEVIALAFLDGDFYDSIMWSLKLIWPKLSKSAGIVVDDYQNDALPGVQKAVDEWLKTHSAILKVESSLAIIYPEVQ
jgi:O-methyltransferase